MKKSDDRYEDMPNKKEFYREKLKEVADKKSSGKKMKKGDFLMYKFIFNEIDPDGVGIISK